VTDRLPVRVSDARSRWGRLAMLLVFAGVAAFSAVEVARIAGIGLRWPGRPPVLLLGGAALMLLPVVSVAIFAGRAWSGWRVDVSADGIGYERLLRRRRLLPWSSVRAVRLGQGAVRVRGRGGARVTIMLAQYEDPAVVVEFVREHVPRDRIHEAEDDALRPLSDAWERHHHGGAL
jgi:hypothetical protein